MSILESNALTKSYNGKRALNNVNLKLGEGLLDFWGRMAAVRLHL